MKEAEVRKTVVVGVLFALNFAMSLYNGVKCVVFQYDEGKVGLEGALLASVILLINYEFFTIRDYLDKLTEEQGELIQHLHMHPLYFETGLKCHICDVCHESTKG